MCVCVSATILELQAVSHPLTRYQRLTTKASQVKSIFLISTLETQEVTAKDVYTQSLMLSTTVSSPCQTLRELLAGEHEMDTDYSQAHQLAIPRMGG